MLLASLLISIVVARQDAPAAGEDGVAPPPSRLALAPAAQPQLMQLVRKVPEDPRTREAAVAELFRLAGAQDVVPTPLDEALVAERRAQALEQARARLEAAGVTAAALAAELGAIEERWQRIGRNVVAILPGPTKRVIVFAAHWDTVAGSPGVLDSWTSCVLLAELLRVLKDSGHQHTFWFVAFAGQEEGCLGSASWVRQLGEKQAAKIDAAVTIDCAGGAAPLAWWGGSSAGILEVAVDVARSVKVPLRVVDLPGEHSDSHEIKRAFVPVAALFGIDSARIGVLHGPEDGVDAVVPSHLVQMHHLTVALAAEFDAWAEPLRWETVQARLRLDDPASGRKPLVPKKISLTSGTPPGAPATPAPARVDPPATDDGSLP